MRKRGGDPIQFETPAIVEAKLKDRGVSDLGAEELLVASGRYQNMMGDSVEIANQSGISHAARESFVLDVIAEGSRGRSITDPSAFGRGDTTRFLVDDTFGY